MLVGTVFSCVHTINTLTSLEQRFFDDVLLVGKVFSVDCCTFLYYVGFRFGRLELGKVLTSEVVP